MTNKNEQGTNNQDELTRDSGSNPEISRRDIFKKYGAYTAPVVVSLLAPGTSYAMNAGTVYSTSAACYADPLGMHVGMTRHCMVDGATGSGSTHTVINPGPV